MARRAVAVGAAVVVVVLLFVVGISGHFLFVRAAEDSLQRADAVVVLGGEHDGREKYGIALAREIGARDVLLSNPYRADDRLMATVCNSRPAGIDVICRRPTPSDTRGEAIMARELGEARGWQRIVVVSWRYHLPRARLIFSQCYSADPGRAIMRAVPKTYNLSFATWEYIYLYQYAGFAKALFQGACDT